MRRYYIVRDSGNKAPNSDLKHSREILLTVSSLNFYLCCRYATIIDISPSQCDAAVYVAHPAMKIARRWPRHFDASACLTVVRSTMVLAAVSVNMYRSARNCHLAAAAVLAARASAGDRRASSPVLLRVLRAGVDGRAEKCLRRARAAKREKWKKRRGKKEVCKISRAGGR